MDRLPTRLLVYTARCWFDPRDLHRFLRGGRPFHLLVECFALSAYWLMPLHLPLPPHTFRARGRCVGGVTEMVPHRSTPFVNTAPRCVILPLCCIRSPLLPLVVDVNDIKRGCGCCAFRRFGVDGYTHDGVRVVAPYRSRVDALVV